MTTSAPLLPLDLLPMESPLMSSAAASHARISASQGMAPGYQEIGQGYGASTPVLLAKLDRATSLWKTSQLCLVEGLETFSQTWPRSGMTRNGIAYQLPPLVRLTGATDFGLLPTPIASNTKAVALRSNGREPMDSTKPIFPTPCARDWKDTGGGKHIPPEVSQPRSGRNDVSDAESLRLQRGDIEGRQNEVLGSWIITQLAGRNRIARGWWDVEPGICRVANGVPNRMDRIKGLGNAVVPQIPEMIGRAILDAEQRGVK
jgi:hypothetical protein